MAYVRRPLHTTYVAKLTLSVDEAVIRRAKRYAARRRTSLSQLVEQYLGLLSLPDPAAAESTDPVLGRLRGVLKGAEASDYLRHLERKYR